MTDDLAYKSAAELALLIRRRAISPVEVMEQTIARIEARNPSLNALIFLGFDDARKAAKEAEAAGADFVGTEFVQKIKDGWTEFDVMIATPDQMGQVGQLGRVLGPRGLMPNPKAGTVTFDVARAVKETKAGKIEFRVDKAGNVQAPIGKVSFSADALETNFSAFMDQIIRSKPAAAKGVYVKTVAVSSTMGPGVRIDTNPYR